MTKAFDQLRAMYSSDEQLARDLFETLAVTRMDLQLQQALRRRAEDKLERGTRRARNDQDKEESQ
nr:hypothetical protein [uncultured Massilia sp.]